MPRAIRRSIDRWSSLSSGPLVRSGDPRSGPTQTDGIDWLELLVQLVVAVIAVAAVVAFGRRRSGLRSGTRS